MKEKCIRQIILDNLIFVGISIEIAIIIANNKKIIIGKYKTRITMAYVEPLTKGVDYENNECTYPSNKGIMTQDGIDALMNIGMGQTNYNHNSIFNYQQDRSPIQHQKERTVLNDQ